MRPRMQRLRPQDTVPGRRAVLALGSNLGDRLGLLAGAVRDLGALPGFRVEAVSKVVETPAWKPDGIDRDAPGYLNAVVLGRTTLAPLALLDATAALEIAHGRLRGPGEERWGDRTLDIDLIALDGVVHDDERLTLPHPRAALRAFVLEPWLDVDPEAELPGLGRVADLRARATDPVRDRPERIPWQRRPLPAAEAEPTSAEPAPPSGEAARTDATRTESSSP